MNKVKIIFEDNKRVCYECIECGAHKVVPMCQWKRGNARFCSRGCATSYRNKINNPMKSESSIKKMKISLEKTRKDMREGTYKPNQRKERREYRAIAFANKKHACEMCGEDNYGVLEVHHKDMDRANNELENLMIVCSKCHHLEIHRNIRVDLGHGFTLEYKNTQTRVEGSETNELIERLESLIKDLKDNNSVAYKQMIGEAEGPQ